MAMLADMTPDLDLRKQPRKENLQRTGRKPK
jgi:hypothetical protein